MTKRNTYGTGTRMGLVLTLVFVIAVIIQSKLLCFLSLGAMVCYALIDEFI